MTDKELLELAVKAAGTEIVWGKWLSRYEWLAKTNTGDLSPWNPLTDDGDALRLALDLGINIGDPHQYTDLALVYTEGRLPSKECWEKIVDGDYYAATRRAIVRAAADIGRE